MRTFLIAGLGIAMSGCGIHSYSATDTTPTHVAKLEQSTGPFSSSTETSVEYPQAAPSKAEPPPRPRHLPAMWAYCSSLYMQYCPPGYLAPPTAYASYPPYR